MIKESKKKEDLSSVNIVKKEHPYLEAMIHQYLTSSKFDLNLADYDRSTT
jgi:hypothetical protein